jgi:hypothetical protein
MADDLNIPVLPGEQWKPIPGREGRYSVSNLGRVRSEPRVVKHGLTETYTVKGQILKTTPSKLGRPQFSDGYENGLLVSLAVAEAFIGPRPPGLLVRHLDDDPLNNRLDNLAYGTYKDNHEDAKRNGRAVKPPNRHMITKSRAHSRRPSD